MQPGRALDKPEKDNDEERFLNHLNLQVERILNELRKVTDRFEEKDLAKAGYQTSDSQRRDEDEFDELVRKATEAFFQGISKSDTDLQKLVEEANNTPLEEYHEPLIRKIDEMERNTWREFWSELLAACIPVFLMSLAISLIIHFGISLAGFQTFIIFAVLSVISVFCLVVWVALRSYLTGAETMRRVVGANWRGALAAGCLLAAVTGWGVLQFRQYWDDGWNIISAYSQELAQRQLTDEAIKRLHRQMINSSFKDGQDYFARKGKVAVDGTETDIQTKPSSEIRLPETLIRITERTVTKDEAILSASGIGLADDIEMKLKPRSGIIYLSQKKHNLLSKVVVGKLMNQIDGKVLLKNPMTSLWVNESAFDIPFSKIRNKMVAVAYKPNDPHNQGEFIRKIERLQILTQDHK